jgi:hypothetical protein
VAGATTPGAGRGRADANRLPHADHARGSSSLAAAW